MGYNHFSCPHRQGSSHRSRQALQSFLLPPQTGVFSLLLAGSCLDGGVVSPTAGTSSSWDVSWTSTSMTSATPVGGGEPHTFASTAQSRWSESSSENYFLVVSCNKAVISEALPFVDETLKAMFSGADGFPRRCKMVDLGCSSGPNTLFIISHILDTIEDLCKREIVLNCLNLRLFPSNTLHFAYSSCSLHWLSQFEPLPKLSNVSYHQVKWNYALNLSLNNPIP
ncbi:UNVERIFIED_CONTAM: Benzoate carboxyl methyltransferase [Sesamum calycinum]|uniref:Benzoate carboxyl methyltransferase n=1 Tax=Sesamum calycinum TaxID=2727403 RepID=A0AAW2NRR1_9LAMI